MKFLIKLGGILYLISCLNSCCPFASNEIESEIHEDSFAWFTIFEDDSKLYERKFIRQWADSTVSFIDTFQFSEYRFYSTACNGECSPTCEVVECKDAAINLEGEDDLLIFNIPCFLIDKNFDFIIDNKGEVIDSVEIIQNNWEQDFRFSNQETIEFNGNIFEDCFQIQYSETRTFNKNSLHFIYCKNEGSIIKEEKRENYDDDLNLVSLITDTTKFL